MQNLSDNDIDKLFKQAADQQQPQFDPADWDDLEKRLDQPKRAPTYFNWTSTIVLLGALVWFSWITVNSFELERVSGGLDSSSGGKSALINTASQLSLNKDTTTFHSPAEGIVSSEQVQSKIAVNKENESEPSEKNGPSILESEIDVTAARKSANDSGSKTNESKNSKQGAKGYNRTGTLVKEFVSAQTGNSHRAVAESDITGADEQESFTTSNDVKEEQPSNLHTNKVLAVGPITNNTNSKGKELNGSVRTLNAEQGITTFSTPSSTKTSGLNDNERKDSLELVSKKHNETKLANANKPADSLNKKDWLRNWAIKATISPDFSADQFKSVEKTGLNYGMMLEYYIHPKFSVSAGAIWSRKYYSAQDVAYGYYQADEVYGDCRMWDIPLNFTYYNSPSKQYSFFFTVGSSSYLMNEENYTYKVETGYGTVSYNKQVLKENNEWFKMLNLSVGVQKQFRERWAIQLEPFIKVPLAGVGEGNIQLSSFGSFFSIRYKILEP